MSYVHKMSSLLIADQIRQKSRSLSSRFKAILIREITSKVPCLIVKKQFSKVEILSKIRKSKSCALLYRLFIPHLHISPMKNPGEAAFCMASLKSTKLRKCRKNSNFGEKKEFIIENILTKNKDAAIKIQCENL